MNVTSDLELFEKIQRHLMQDARPSVFLQHIGGSHQLQKPPFDLLWRLQTTEQSPQHHPEGSVWNHTLLVVDEAAKVRSQSKKPVGFMWAALLHDIGKPSTTRVRRGRITSYDHDKVGTKLAEKFLRSFGQKDALIDYVCGLIRYHMHILFVLKNMPFADAKGMLRESDVEEVALLGLCDRLGRAGANPKQERENIRLFLKKCSEMQE